MRGLVLHLAKLDSEAEMQVRIVDFFDSLLRSHAHLEHVLRATAGLAGVPVGVTLLPSEQIIGFDNHGNRLELDPEAFKPSDERLIISSGRRVARAWLDDDDGPSRTAALLLERLVLTCEVLWEADELGSEGRAVERLLDSDAAASEHLLVARLLRGRLPEVVRSVCIAPATEPSRFDDWYETSEQAVAKALNVPRQALVPLHSRGKL